MLSVVLRGTDPGEPPGADGQSYRVRLSENALRVSNLPLSALSCSARMVAEGTKLGMGLCVEASSSTVGPEGFAILFRGDSVSESYSNRWFSKGSSVHV